MIHVFVVGYFYIIKSLEFILFFFYQNLQVCMFKIGNLTDFQKNMHLLLSFFIQLLKL